MKKLFQGLVAVGILMGVTACNTVEGAGKDVEYAGEKIQDASDKVEEELDE